MKTDPNTGERLFDVEIYTTSGGHIVVEDLVEIDAVWLMNAADEGYNFDAPHDHDGDFVVGDLTNTASAFSVNNSRIVLAHIRA